MQRSGNAALGKQKARAACATIFTKFSLNLYACFIIYDCSQVARECKHWP